MNFNSYFDEKFCTWGPNLVGIDIAMSLGSQKVVRKYKNAHHDGYVAAGA